MWHTQSQCSTASWLDTLLEGRPSLTHHRPGVEDAQHGIRFWDILENEQGTQELLLSFICAIRSSCVCMPGCVRTRIHCAKRLLTVGAAPSICLMGAFLNLDSQGAISSFAHFYVFFS